MPLYSKILVLEHVSDPKSSSFTLGYRYSIFIQKLCKNQAYFCPILTILPKFDLFVTFYIFTHKTHKISNIFKISFLHSIELFKTYKMVYAFFHFGKILGVENPKNLTFATFLVLFEVWTQGKCLLVKISWSFLMYFEETKKIDVRSQLRKMSGKGWNLKISCFWNICTGLNAPIQENIGAWACLRP